MKKFFIVLLESFVLTVFFTLVSQALFLDKTPSSKCHGKSLNLKKCESKAETSRGFWR